MPRIHLLPPSVVSKIAAGEVIERPSSVVKELLENAVDAGSTRIDIDLEQGGTECIRVVDNGCGIAADDITLAFTQHATSKLHEATDLLSITTMGFRGEALASIAGVSKVTLQSRPAAEPTGCEIRCEGSEVFPSRPWNGAPGTRIDVRHLFYNVPVRKKFLKTHATELGHACETVTRLALANPGLHLTLKHNGKGVYDIPASATLLDRIQLFFGKEVGSGLYPIDSLGGRELPPGGMRLTGFIADPKCDRGNAKLQYLFVNGRWFRDRSLTHALQEAYRGLLMTGRYPIAFLFLHIPPDRVDVNVHPTKSEVRFQENSSVYSLVRATIKERLMRENLVPRLNVPSLEAVPVEFVGSGGDDEPDPPPQAMNPFAAGFPAAPMPATTPSFLPPLAYPTRTPILANEPMPPPPAVPAPPPPEPQPVAPPQPEPARFFTPPTPIPAGTALQVHDAYLVLESEDGMVVIDQHALHERILFEQYLRRIRDGQLEVQRLLIPEPIDLPAEQAALVLEAEESLRELGLEISDFGGNTILLSSYPTLLGRRPPHIIFEGVIDHLMNKERAPTKEALLHGLMATMACKAAVKAGDKLSPEEIAYLLHLRQLAEDSHHCPHGRPTSLLFSRRELDKQFRRT